MPRVSIFSGENLVISLPENTTFPKSLFATPAIDKIVEDFPAPLAPSKTTVSPWLTKKSTFLTAITGP